jgi:hypothetical protein
MPILAFIFLNCKDDSELINVLTKLSKNKVDITDYIADYQLIDFFVNDNNLCLTYTNDDSNYFTVINEDKTSNTVKDVFNDYIFTSFSYCNNIATNSSSSFNKNMIFYDLKKNTEISIIVKEPFSFSNVKSCNEYLYFYGGTEGNCIYSFKNNSFKNESKNISYNPYSSNISAPLDSNYILLSEGFRDELSLKCYDKDSIRWEKILPVNVFSQLRIINFNNFYIVYFDNKVIKLNKIDGENLTEFDLKSDSFKIFVINDELYIIEKTVSEKYINCKISILDTKLNTLIEKKSFDFNKEQDVYINVLNETIIFSTDETIKFCDVKNLKCKELKLNSPVFLENYIDDKTGNNFLLMNNKHIFY